MSDARPQPASWETKDHRVEEEPADWLVKVTCLIGDCGWWTEWRGGYAAAHRVTDQRLKAHQEVHQYDGTKP